MELINEIKQIVKEELGISDELNKYYDDILSQTITAARMTGKTVRPNVKAGTFLYRIGTANIQINYKVVYVGNMGEFDESEFAGSSDYMDSRHLSMDITLVYDRSQNKYIDLDGTLQHELEHVFQQLKAKTPFLANEKTGKMYGKARDLVHNATSKSEAVVGLAVYYNSKFEKDAYANDIYRSIMDNRQDNPYTVLKNNMTYKNVAFIRRVVLEKDNREKLEPIVKKTFGKSYEWFLGVTEHMVKAFMSKVGKVMTKAIKDIELENEQNYTTDGGRLATRGITLEGDQL